jgi:hypothetical protein
VTILGLFAVQLDGCQQRCEAKIPSEEKKAVQSRGEKILLDTTFFPEEFALTLTRLFGRLASAGVPVEKGIGMSVPEGHQPNISEIEKKYGKADKTEVGVRVPGFAEPKEAMVYHYEPLWLAVPTSQADQKVTWVWLAAAVQAPTPKAFVIAEKILSDKALFSGQFSKDMQPKLEFAEQTLPCEFWAPVPVPEPQPKLESIVSKYGKPDNVVEEQKSQWMPADATLHYYGRIGFGVREGQGVGNVAWVALGYSPAHARELCR